MPTFSSNAAPVAGNGITVTGATVSLKTGGGLNNAPVIIASGYTAAAPIGGANIFSVTTPGTDATVLISAFVNITTALATGTRLELTWTDETNTANITRIHFNGAFATGTANQPVDAAGIATAEVSGPGFCMWGPVIVRCKASTTLTLATVGANASGAYDIGGMAMQVG